MAYQLDFSISLGSTKTALTLAAQLMDSDGVDVGAAVSTGFTEVGTGCYIWKGSIPDLHQGGVKFYESGVPGTILAFASINPIDEAVARMATLVIGNIATAQQVPEVFTYNGIKATVTGDAKGNRTVVFGTV